MVEKIDIFKSAHEFVRKKCERFRIDDNGDFPDCEGMAEGFCSWCLYYIRKHNVGIIRPTIEEG